MIGDILMALFVMWIVLMCLGLLVGYALVFSCLWREWRDG